MTLPVYLAMTAEEINASTSLPPDIAYMACHFAPYGTGLTNLPGHLPSGALLIVNDRIPVHSHDPQQIIAQLQLLLGQVKPCGILLDLQRPHCPRTLAIAQAIVESIPAPIAVSEQYAQQLQCPVFLSTPPLHVPLSAHIGPWKGREIWLDTGLQACTFTVTEAGSKAEACPLPEGPLPFEDKQLHCHYRIQTKPDTVIFTLQRTWEDLQALLEEGKKLGVTKAVGLHQELKQ